MPIAAVLFDLREADAVEAAYSALEALFAGLAFLGLLSTIWMQRSELRLQRSELAQTREEMRLILEEVQTGEFAREWILENQAGRPVFNALRRIEAEHPIEEVGQKLRGMMSWLKRK